MTSHQDFEYQSHAHLEVTELLNVLMNQLRDHGYNPSNHLFYGSSEQHMVLDEEISNSHPDIAETYTQYLNACRYRSEEELHGTTEDSQRN